MVKSEIERGLPFVIPDRMCEFQMICLRGTQMRDIYERTDVLNVPDVEQRRHKTEGSSKVNIQCHTRDHIDTFMSCVSFK